MTRYWATNLAPARKGTVRIIFRLRTTFAWFALGVLATLAACVWATPEPQLIREPRPDPVPMRIGVHFPPQLRDFTYRHHFTDTAYVLGEPSVRLLKEALALLFVEVVESPLPSPDSPLRGDLAGVIEPRISSAGFKFPSPGSPSFPAHVTYGFTLYSSRGEQIASWDVTGQAGEPIANIFSPVSAVKRNFELAMQEATLKLTSGFRKVPEVRRWLDEQGVR